MENTTKIVIPPSSLEAPRAPKAVSVGPHQFSENIILQATKRNETIKPNKMNW